MPRKSNLWISAIIIVTILVIHSSTVLLSEGDYALHTRFGKVHRALTTPGFYLKLPWPLDDIHVLEGRLHLYQGEDEQILTGDQNSLVVSSHVMWKIVPERLTEFWEKVESVEHFELLLESRLRSYRNALFGNITFSKLFSKQKERNIQELEKQLKSQLETSCKNDYGIEILAAGFSHIGLASGVLESVFEKMNADRSRLANQLQAEGESIANKIKAEAQSEFDQAMATIAGNVKTILAKAEADSIEAYKTMAEHPELAIKLKKIETIEALLKDRATLILDRDTIPMDILYSTSR